MTDRAAGTQIVVPAVGALEWGSGIYEPDQPDAVLDYQLGMLLVTCQSFEHILTRTRLLS